MNKAQVPYQKRKNQPEIRAWSGLNRTYGCADGEIRECRNISTREYPALSTMHGCNRIGEWQNATDIFETDGHLIVVDEGKLYYDGTFLSNVDNQRKQFAEINRLLVIWPDKLYINLNTGELGAIEAEVGGTADAIGETMLAMINAAGTGSIDVRTWAYEWWNAVEGHWEKESSEIYFRCYDDLTYDKDAGEDKWIVTNAKTLKDAPQGYFIGSKPETKTYYTDFGWSMEGSVYGRITSSEVISESKSESMEPGGDGKNYVSYLSEKITRYHFSLFDGEGAALSTLFEAGDTVNIEGSALKYNNKKGVILQGVEENRFSFNAEDMMIAGAIYYDVTQDLTEGHYSLTAENDSNNVGQFKATRTIRAGEQLFKPNEEKNGLEVAVYAYDPKLQRLEKMQSASGSDGGQTLTATVYTMPESGINITRKAPDMDFICERNNRLYGVSNAEEETIFNAQTGKYETVTSRVLHASALGSVTRWNEFQGASTDSYAVAIAGEGNFTAICNYSGGVLAFKEDKMYKLTGDYPAEFYLRSYSVDGVKAGCHKSLCIINEVLYFLSPYGVMRYSGGVPQLISYNLGTMEYTDAVAGRDKTNYYINMYDPEIGIERTFCYDTLRDMWSVEEPQKVSSIARVGDYAYVCRFGNVWKINDPTSNNTVYWNATLNETDEGTMDVKRYKELRMDLSVIGMMEVYLSLDGKEEKLVRRFNDVERSIQRIQLDNRCRKMQIRLEGEGRAIIWALERSFTIEGEQ